MKQMTVRAGQMIGLQHITRQMNYQDSHALLETESAVIAVVCDGCSEGTHSEVGATLTAQYLISQAATLLADGCAPEAIPAMLHGRIVSYLHQLVKLLQPVNPVEFVRHHLLFTIVGLIVTDNGGVIFTAGDGLLSIDDVLICIDQANKPAYIAYHLLQNALEDGFKLPAGFEVYPVRADWQRLAIATDGFLPELMPHVWNLKHPRGLQRKLNVWGSQERRFEDDATLIVVEREVNDAAGHD